MLPQADEVFRTASTEQAALEKRGCQNEDEAAEPTALMTQALFDAAAPQGAGHTAVSYTHLAVYKRQVLMHDTKKETVQALGDIIRWFKNAGYRFDTVDHMPKST